MESGELALLLSQMVMSYKKEPESEDATVYCFTS